LGLGKRERAPRYPREAKPGGWPAPGV
jgi:hypothetical protein